ncbi:aldo/keto reductase [Pseudopedobacter saltans DSM 12145]|uniref:Aldo/keto reductase n=1 Tax=Pseudopedobacter saltans (strain ATCC 51119 / DSM 12145 / JCM 21818 / CCUG 39354 / LMG 10337 / NBRC 100064 / NCIMB 13643) TaxID=762903 RepID=F0S6I9_PSESL|nr:aldo/keto reductase [Pseudopedobacter saltans]ADY51065.1 aldo/keto reductase [Pseudopedobacter saltans DSM 12145]
MLSQDIETIPPVIFGTSGLGNIYEALPFERKLAIVEQCIKHSPGIPVFDSAGKYGAGLSLEVLGQCLEELNVDPCQVIINNKLGWYQTELTTPEPTFEKGIWIDMKNDAVQKISYQGIIDCFEQGNELLGKYNSDMVSVHDPDEYLAAAKDEMDAKKRYQDIMDAYRALGDLKRQGRAKSIGIGSKDWTVIKRIAQDIQLDWVMIANSLTAHSHPKDLIDFIGKLKDKGVTVINSAVFNGGFLIGSNFYNYVEVNAETERGRELLAWREQFYALCEEFAITPAEACFNFGFNIKGVSSVALSTTKPEKVKGNIEMATKQIPQTFWDAMREKGLIQI